MNLTCNLPEDELNDDWQEIVSGILDQYPFIGDLLEDYVAETNGRVNMWDFGIPFMWVSVFKPGYC